jgi:hypothetical protein
MRIGIFLMGVGLVAFQVGGCAATRVRDIAKKRSGDCSSRLPPSHAMRAGVFIHSLKKRQFVESAEKRRGFTT